MAIGENKMHVGISNSLFIENHAYYGGAVELYEYSLSAFDRLITFSFFQKNTGTYGNDVHFDITLPRNSPLLHCFSLSATNRVYDNKTKATHNDDWLPQGSIYLQISTSDGRSNIPAETTPT